ncbi:aminotransferase class V-fold PLP-dependent enzyme [Parvularcula marina]|uniref:Aminotransferase class V-fold PLP-dependent enzyme n=2 Tax=Parvularcula marina TaxID=2292771 RepID=A0A371REQ0_9PROT|nr:aminotransferase class V-fold PLP-dependent enzyme [Parvularcula marina]
MTRTARATAKGDLTMSIAADIRAKFEMPEGIYLLNHSVGCLPRAARRALEDQWFGPWAEKGSDGWGEWIAAVDHFREMVARLIGAQPDDICPQTNLSGGLSKILCALPVREDRHKIVLCEEDFPTVGFVAAAAAHFGLETEFIPRGDAATDPDVWAKHLDGAHVAFITHTFSNRSARLPVAEITKLARERDVYSVVDAVQASGVIPYAVDDLGADFLLGTSVKFLCGGSGAGFLWATKDAAEKCSPVDTGWFSHENPFEFDIRNYRVAPGARRFWGGTPSIAPYVVAATGIETLLQSGVEAIHAHNQSLIDRLHEGLPDGALASERDRERRGNAVLIHVADAGEALEKMKSLSIRMDTREGCLRLSPHLYNTMEEMDLVLEALGPFLK